MAESPLSGEEIGQRAREAVSQALKRNIPGLTPPTELTLDVEPTPRETIHSRGTLKVYHYTPVCDEIYRVPVVLVMSLVSRSYIFDLAEGQSLVEFLIGRGFDVSIELLSLAKMLPRFFCA